MTMFACQSVDGDLLLPVLAHNGDDGYWVEVSVVEDDCVQSVCLTPDAANRLSEELSRLADMARARGKTG